MGLTIHYSIDAGDAYRASALALAEEMRQLALDLPFDRVDEHMSHLSPEECAGGLDRYRGKDEERFNLVLASTTSVKLTSRSSFRVCPDEVIGFFVHPAPGSELAFIGLARYPVTIEVPDSEGGHPTVVKVNRAGWQLRSFSKTQYASDPSVGSVAAFLRAHIGLITLLERIGDLPGVEVEIDDEGKYGPSRYSTDWKDALREGQEPTYQKHPGQYNPRTLAEEVGRWNEHVAAVVGAFSDLPQRNDGGVVNAPILDHPEFERLEFRGQQAAREGGVDALLKLLAAMGEGDG